MPIIIRTIQDATALRRGVSRLLLRIDAADLPTGVFTLVAYWLTSQSR
jgi:hypothetical protein